MTKNEKKENIVVKRDYIDNAVFEEIKEKYPQVTVKGVAYNLGLTYITVETDYFNDPIVRKLIKEYGAEIISVICFFRMKMCQPYGWYCRIDEDSLDTLIEDCAYTLKIAEDKVRECYQALIDKQAFFLISDKSGEYVADVQQLYNFEILNNGRLRDRLRKQAARAKAKEEAEKKKEETERAEQTKTIPTASASVNEEPTEQSIHEEELFNMAEDDKDPFDW